MNSRRQRAIVATAVAALLATAGATGLSTQVQADEGAHKAHCYGVNKCKGTGDCGGKGHSCAGKNGCEGKGFLSLDKETCLKIKGGSLTP